MWKLSFSWSIKKFLGKRWKSCVSIQWIGSFPVPLARLYLSEFWPLPWVLEVLLAFLLASAPSRHPSTVAFVCEGILPTTILITIFPHRVRQHFSGRVFVHQQGQTFLTVEETINKTKEKRNMFWLHDIHAFLSVSPVVVWEWGLIRITESTQSQPHWLVKSPLQAHVLRSFFRRTCGTLPIFFCVNHPQSLCSHVR